MWSVFLSIVKRYGQFYDRQENSLDRNFYIAYSFASLLRHGLCGPRLLRGVRSRQSPCFHPHVSTRLIPSPMSFTVYTIYNQVFKIWRARRFALFCRTFGLSTETADASGIKLLDVGGWPWDWIHRPRVVAHIDTLNLTPPNFDPAKYLGQSIGVLVGDGCAMSFSDRQYDIVYSNSVIEHLGTWERQQQFASELQRVGKGVWCQTPAFECPIEPHYMAPFIHWLPKKVQRRLLRHFTPMGLISHLSSVKADRWIADTRLLSKREMRNLFPSCVIHTEFLIPWLIPKSYIAYRK